MMSVLRHTLRFCLFVVLLAPTTLAAEPKPPEAKAVKGEPIDPTLFGPGVVEGMDAVLARQATLANQPPVNPKARNGRPGTWVVPSRRATYHPHSGRLNIVNKWGDTRMGISFHKVVDVKGAYFAGQGGGPGVWTSGVRAIGYRAGHEVSVTDWFTDIGAKPRWFAMNLTGIDRIVIEARPVFNGAGWYGIDDLTFAAAASDGSVKTRVLDFEDCHFRQKLTGTTYAGLTWESGTGEFNTGDAMPPPASLPDTQPGEPGPPQPPPPAPRGTVPPPVVGLDWDAVRRGDSGQNAFPPDTCGAIGPNHFVEVVNRVFAVYDKTNGTLVNESSLGAFLPGSNGDPRVLFDQYSGRWVIVVSDFNTRVFLAVSTTNDPTGTWFKTSFVVSTGSDSGCFPDYPTLGADANGFYVSSFMVGCGMSIFAIDKAPLIAPSQSLGTVTAFRGLPIEGAIQPVHTWGTTPGEYFISRWNSSSLRIRRVDPPLTNPALLDFGLVTVPGHGFPPDAPAMGSNTLLDTVDHRLMNAVFRNGSIWAAHAIGLSGRAACRWYEVDPVALSLIQSGTISDPSLYYFFPSITVDVAGNVVMGFSGSDANQFAAAYFTGRRAIDPPGMMSAPVLLRAGSAPQNNIDSFGRNRWGDYSLTSMDPSNELTFWTIQEYADATNVWGTHVGKIIYGDTTPPSPAPTFILPVTVTDTSVSMTSTTASDVDSPPVEYFFQSNGVLGANDSGWQLTTAYTDTGLQPNTGYLYWVKARDGAPLLNETPLSFPAITRTLAAVPGAPLLSNPTDATLDLDTDPGANAAFTELAVQCTATSPFDSTWDGQFVAAAGTPSATAVWQTDPTWGTTTVQTLQPLTTYAFQVKARNFDGVETALGLAASIDTLPAPVTCSLQGDVNQDGVVNGSDIGGYVRAKLGLAPAPGEEPACADFGTGDLNMDTTLFVSLLLG